MGEEIGCSEVETVNPDEFRRRARAETQILSQWFEEGRFEEDDSHFGLELKAYLVDRDGLPSFRNNEFLDHLDDPSFVPSLLSTDLRVVRQDVLGYIMHEEQVCPCEQPFS